MAKSDNVILITGGSGFIATSLTRILLKKGYRVRSIDIRKSRLQHKDLRSWQLDINQHELPLGILDDVHTVIHLAGEPIYGYWTKKKKKRIYDSRVGIAEKLKIAIAHQKKKISVYISASATGIYGDSGEHILDEYSQTGSDYLARVCLDWESRSVDIGALGIREVRIRTAPVLGGGGLLPMFHSYFKTGFGFWLGSGRQWFPWIHIDDLLRIYMAAIEDNRLCGAVNASAGACRQREFTKHYGEVYNKSVITGVPKGMLVFRYGGLAEAMLASQHVVPSAQLRNIGFEFSYIEVNQALQSLRKGL